MIRIDKLEHNGFQYLLCYPKNYEPGKKYPVLLHYHGAGGRGKDFKEFEDSNILKMVREGNTPFANGFCVFPQCSTDTWFDRFSELLEFTKFIYNSDFTDKKRFNGSGISMGGYTVYQVMICLPELFNKAMVCCGGGMYWNACRMKNIHLRIFHGEQDVAVFPEESRRMFARLQEANADATLTIFPECDHNCWDKAFGNMDNLKWLFE